MSVTGARGAVRPLYAAVQRIRTLRVHGGGHQRSERRQSSQPPDPRHAFSAQERRDARQSMYPITVEQEGVLHVTVWPYALVFTRV